MVPAGWIGLAWILCLANVCHKVCGPVCSLVNLPKTVPTEVLVLASTTAPKIIACVRAIKTANPGCFANMRRQHPTPKTPVFVRKSSLRPNVRRDIGVTRFKTCTKFVFLYLRANRVMLATVSINAYLTMPVWNIRKNPDISFVCDLVAPVWLAPKERVLRSVVAMFVCAKQTINVLLVTNATPNSLRDGDYVNVILHNAKIVATVFARPTKARLAKPVLPIVGA